jgi:hypothetical protein
MDGDRGHGELRTRRRFPFGRAWTFLLAVVTLGLVTVWVRSFWTCDAAAFFTPAGAVQLAVAYRGTFVVAVTDVSFGDERGPGFEFGSATPEAVERGRMHMSASADLEKGRWGFGYAYGHWGLRGSESPKGWRFWSAHAPAWAVVAPLALLLARRVARPLRVMRRRRRGLCPACAYDLRGLLVGRCPECGNLGAAPAPVAGAPAAVSSAG